MTLCFGVSFWCCPPLARRFYRCEWCFRRPGQYFARRLEPRAVARTIPGLLGAIPTNQTPHVCTHGGNFVQPAFFIARTRHPLAVQFQDLPLAALDGAG